ncbi:MAG: DUF4406 domain-containing protein [Pseudomonadota bacterium]
MSRWIMIAGPYRAGAADAEARATNLRALNDAARRVLALGHVPVIGVNMALPVIEAAEAAGEEEAFERIMMPLSLALTKRCDAVLRIGGVSDGADAELRRFEVAGRPVFRSIDELPVPEGVR